MKTYSMKMKLPRAISELHEAFKKHSQPLFLVGGCVRDSFGPHPIKDYDLATPATPDEVLKILSGYSVRTVGKFFGVVLVSIDGEDYEIATFRKDSKTSDGRRPDYVEFSSIEEDALRRDLTINALYYNIEKQEIWDFHGGLADLLSGFVRFVGNADERLAEDKLRALRVVRFHNRLNIGPLVLPELKTCVLRPEISEERIRDEFLKGLASAISYDNYLQDLRDCNLLSQVFPGLEVSDIESGPRNLAANYHFILARLLRKNKDVRQKLLDLKYTASEANTVEFLIKLGGYRDIVLFKKMRKRCCLADRFIRGHALDYYPDLPIAKMLSFPYPTVRGEDLPYEGKELGEKMAEKERENFLNFLNTA